MSYSLNSFKGEIWGIIQGTTIGVIKGDTRSLDLSHMFCIHIGTYTHSHAHTHLCIYT